MENRSEYFKALRRVVLPNNKRKIIKEMKSEQLKEFLKSQNICWHGSVLNKNGLLFRPETIAEIKKDSKFDLTVSEQGLRTFLDVDFGENYFVISAYDKNYILFLSDKWEKFLEDYTNNQTSGVEL